MKDKTIELFSEADKKFMDRLQLLGMSRKAAGVFTYLLQRESGSSRMIEITSGLRQPEVSIGIQEISTWITITPVAPDNGGRQRKTLYYSLAVPWKEVVRHYYQESCAEFDKVQAAFTELVDLDAPI
ncbi:MAG: hypothetical protein WC248_00395 [Candidatus Methanomethylophilaceae archaeon]|jgi:predicted transcriptional regulator